MNLHFQEKLSNLMLRFGEIVINMRRVWSIANQPSPDLMVMYTQHFFVFYRN